MIVPNPHIQTPEYSIRRVRDDETQLPENSQISYQIPAAPASVDPVEREREAARQSSRPWRRCCPRPRRPVAAAAAGTRRRPER